MNRVERVATQSEAEILLDKGFFQQAELRLRADLLETPDDPWKQALLGRALLHQGRLEEGEGLLERSRELAPEDPRILSEWSVLPAMRDAPDDALYILAKAEAARPDDPEIISRQGLILLTCEEMEEAEKLFRKAIRIAPERARARVELGQLLLQREQYEEAAEVLSHVTDCHHLVNRLLAEIFCHLDMFDEALKHAEMELRNNPEDSTSWSYKAFALSRLGREEEARAALDESARFSEDSTTANSTRATILFKLGRWEDALPAMEEMIMDHPLSPFWTVRYAQCLDNLGRRPDAEDNFRHALMLDPSNGETLEAFATFFEKHHEFPRAIELRTRLAELQPENELLWLNLLLDEYRYGTIGAALEAWRRIRKRSEVFLPMYCASSMELSIRFDRSAEALEAARIFNELDALDANPVRLHVKRDSLGDVCGLGIENAPPLVLNVVQATLPLEDLEASPNLRADYGFTPEGAWQDPGLGAVKPAYTRDELLALEREAARPWREVISRSRKRPGCFYVRDAVYPPDDLPEEWKRLREICARLGIWHDERRFCAPIGPESWELNSLFLDGGLVARGGTYTPTNGPSPGAWITGGNAMRFACYVLGLTQPRRFALERCVPRYADLCETILLQRRLPEGVLRTRFRRMEDSYGLDFTFKTRDLPCADKS